MKRIIALLVSLLLAFSCFGCGASQEAAEEAPVLQAGFFGQKRNQAGDEADLHQRKKKTAHSLRKVKKLTHIHSSISFGNYSMS